MLHIKSVRYLSGYKLWVSFNDASSGEVDLSGELSGTMFEPLCDEKLFSQVSVDPELETLVWPNGADLAPEYLKELQLRQSQQAG